MGERLQQQIKSSQESSVVSPEDSATSSNSVVEEAAKTGAPPETIYTSSPVAAGCKPSSETSAEREVARTAPAPHPQLALPPRESSRTAQPVDNNSFGSWLKDLMLSVNSQRADRFATSFHRPRNASSGAGRAGEIDFSLSSLLLQRRAAARSMLPGPQYVEVYRPG